MKIIVHWLTLIISFAFVFIWNQSQLDNFTIPLLVLMAIIFVLAVILNKRTGKELVGGPVDIFLLNSAILLTITITGNLYSPLYFLLYFLGFGITFVFEPISVFVYILGAIAIFLPEALKNGSIESFIRLGSLILISPLAFFFGNEFKSKNTNETKSEQAIKQNIKQEEKGNAETSKAKLASPEQKGLPNQSKNLKLK